MHTLSITSFCILALASQPAFSAAIERRSGGTDFSDLVDKTFVWAKLRPDEGKPWSMYQMTSMIMPDDNADYIYVNCIKSGEDHKGCPVELPWNEKGCFVWVAGGSISWRKCNRRHSGDAFWDAGSIFKRIYEEEPINNDPSRYDEFTKNPERFEILNRLAAQ